MYYKRVLTVAGSDPSGGAGIQADLKTISACGCYGMSAITAVVDENTLGVYGVHPIPPDFIRGQIHSALDDIGAAAIKIGLQHDSEVIRTVKDTLQEYAIRQIVLDPVMVATSGDKLLLDEAINSLIHDLIPLARVITPNLPEAAMLLGRDIRIEDDLESIAKELAGRTGVSVWLKAGHRTTETLTDVFYNAETDEVLSLDCPRVNTPNTHGTGCTLSSALASFLAHGLPLNEAVKQAKAYLDQAIRHGARYTIGKGHGPVHHFFRFWS
jgi:hydroxymethylpyrimidine/phosphomethylpyrimidine kinase